MRKKNLTFSQAVRSARPTAFSVMLKPVGSACNLRCSYCYYLDKEAFLHKGNLDDQLTKKIVKETIEANDVDEVSFCFHGGEPLLAGMEYFDKVLQYQREFAGDKKITNTVQTNATLMNDSWAEFFRDNEILVGVSLDGPEDLHNANRGASWAKVMRGVECLNRAGTEFNTLTAVSRASAGRGTEIYKFFRSIGSQFHQYLPVAEFVDSSTKRIAANDGDVAAWSLTGAQWGRFCKDVFNEWVIKDVGTTFVSLFDATLAGYCSVQPGICVFGENCGTALTVEHNGDTFSCDHFVYPDKVLGNVKDMSIGEMYKSREHFRFQADKSSGIGEQCSKCQFWRLCYGECPKHRDSEGNNILCEGYKEFFRYSRPYFEKMRELLEAGHSPSGVMTYARSLWGF